MSVAKKQKKDRITHLLQKFIEGGAPVENSETSMFQNQKYRHEAIGCTFSQSVTRLIKRKKLRRPFKLSHKYHYNSTWEHQNYTDSGSQKRQSTTPIGSAQKERGTQHLDPLKATGCLVLLCFAILLLAS